MAKAIPKKGSRGRISSRKNIRKIPKGVIHIQASFNNCNIRQKMGFSNPLRLLTEHPVKISIACLKLKLIFNNT